MPGSHAGRNGRPPDPMAQRRKRPSDQHTWEHLPVEGRLGDAPPWPLPGRMTSWESRKWNELWRTPQAVMWERLGLHDLVAGFLLATTAMTKRRSAANFGAWLRMQTSLGLNAEGMAYNRWRIDGGGGDPPASVRRPVQGLSVEQRLALATRGDA